MFKSKFSSSDDRFNGKLEGYNFIKGEDGVSPIVEVSEIADGHRINIIDVNGGHYFDVLNGRDGRDGAPGKDGKNGEDYILTEADKTEVANKAYKQMQQDNFVGYKGGAEGAGYFNKYDSAIEENIADGRACTVFGYNNKIYANFDKWSPAEFTPVPKTSYGYHGFLAGGNNVLMGYSSVGLGENLEVIGFRSGAVGYFLKAYAGRQFVIGVCNEPDLPANNDPNQKGKYAFIIGGGTTDKRKNIFTVDWNGNATCSGSVKATNANGVVVDLLAKITSLESTITSLQTKIDGLVSAEEVSF